MDGLNDDSVGIVGRSSMKPYLPRIFSTGKSHLESRGIVSLFVSKTNQQQHAIRLKEVQVRYGDHLEEESFGISISILI